MAEGVEFDEDKNNFARPATHPPAQPVFSGGGAPVGGPIGVGGGKIPGMSRWLIEHGFAGSSTAAQVILIAVVVINILITFVIVKYFL